MKKLSLFLLILLCSVNVFSDPIVSGLGVFYKTPYEEALTQLKKEGFEVNETKNFKDESKDEIMISTAPFTLENMNFNQGAFTFKKDSDGVYKFTTAMAISFDLNSPYYEQYYQKLSTKYRKIKLSDADCFLGDNSGKIVFSVENHVLIIAYMPNESSL